MIDETAVAAVTIDLSTRLMCWMILQISHFCFIWDSEKEKNGSHGDCVRIQWEGVE